MHSTAFSGNSKLLGATLPYQWVITLFVLAPPPSFYHQHRQQQQQNRRNFCDICNRLIYALYFVAFLLLSVWTTYVNNIFIDIVVSDYDLDSISNILSVCGNFGNTAVQTIMQLTSLLGYHHLCDIFTNIALLGEDIRRCRLRRQSADRLQNPEKSFINAALTTFHWRLASRSGALLIFLLIPMPFVNYHLAANSMPWNVKLLTVFFSIRVQVKSAEYCIFVQLVHELLLQLQQDLLQLRREIFKCVERGGGGGGGGGGGAFHHLLCVDLQINQQILARIWNLVLQIEDYFAIPMLVLFLFNGLAITHTINWTYITFSDDTYNSYRITYAVMIIVNMLVPCWLSQSCIDVYNQFGSLLHNLKSNGSDVTLSMRLQEYSLQLMQQRMLFTCGGYFDINLKYFGAMILTITTYVVILIQFKLQTGTEAQQQKAETIIIKYKEQISNLNLN